MVLAALTLAVALMTQLSARGEGKEAGRSLAGPAPVEIAAIAHGAMEDRRTFSGTLVPRAQFIVSPKVSGRVESLLVDVGDPVAPGDVLAELDDEEFVQAVAQAQADLEVARANMALATSALEIAQREHERMQTLLDRQVASASAMDAARADLHAKEAQIQVTKAQVQRAEASLESQRVRLGYTKVVATWPGGEEPRIVSERYVDEGATIPANEPIAAVVDNSRVRAVLFVTERDYARLAVGQHVVLNTDAYPGREFAGQVLRLAPVFEEASRQARVEIDIPNPDRQLKPGMFVRADVVLSVAQDATIVPTEAIVRRGGQAGVFVVSESGDRVRWTPVRPGVEAGGRTQLLGDRLEGQVVTLGQQMLEDGSAIRVSQRRGAAAGAGG